MNEIVVISQAELDSVPVDFHGRIYVKFGTPGNKAIVNKRFLFPVVAWENSSVVARENSSVVARENSSVVARENSSVVARENSSVVAWENSSVAARENSTVEARGNSSVEAWGNSSVVARENSSVVAWENSSVVAWENSSVAARENSTVEARGNSSVVAWENSSVAARENSTVEARENSSVVAWENSSVVAWENSSVEAWGNSSVEAWENSSVVAWGNAQVVQTSRESSISLRGNSRVVHYPKTVNEYIEFVGDIEHDESTVKLFKAVHSRDGKYYSDYDPRFEYVVGKTATADSTTYDPEIMCGHGIHIADKSWCVAYGQPWEDLAIIEVEVLKNELIIPYNSSGKVRASRVNVIREVPLEECGLLGKILARKKVQNEQ